MFKHFKFLALTGVCFLALGWIFFVYKTSAEVKSSKQKAYSLKMNLIELRWNQIMGREVTTDLAQGPEIFSVELSSFDHVIVGSKFRPKYKDIKPSSVKAAYLDSGKNEMFFTTEINDETFFVKVSKKTEQVLLQGFTYAYVLNLLNAGLNESEWYIINAKNQVLFSHEASYLGRSKSFQAVQSRTIKAGAKRYSIQIVDPSPMQTAGVLWLGLIGFLFIGLSHFSGSSLPDMEKVLSVPMDILPSQSLKEEVVESVSRKEEREDEVEEFAEKPLVSKEDNFVSVAASDSRPQRTAAIATSAPQKDVGFEQDAKKDDTKDGTKDNNLGYSEFLTENPSLNMKMPALPDQKIIEEESSQDRVLAEEAAHEEQRLLEQEEETVAVDEVLIDEEAVAPSVDTERSGGDWLKLAEELSASLEKFADEWQEDSIATEENKV